LVEKQDDPYPRYYKSTIGSIYVRFASDNEGHGLSPEGRFDTCANESAFIKAGRTRITCEVAEKMASEKLGYPRGFTRHEDGKNFTTVIALSESGPFLGGLRTGDPIRQLVNGCFTIDEFESHVRSGIRTRLPRAEVDRLIAEARAAGVIPPEKPEAREIIATFQPKPTPEPVLTFWANPQHIAVRAHRFSQGQWWVQLDLYREKPFDGYERYQIVRVPNADE
jgi:hypothetical protein